jgi:16S rRNA (uracil1498-N3)-methyltransferase
VRRCALQRQQLLAETLSLEDVETRRYLARALRLRVGDSVEFFDGAGAARCAVLSEVSSKQIVGVWSESLRIVLPDMRGPVPVLAHLKGNQHDEAVRIAGELGLAEIRFFRARRDARGGPPGTGEQDRLRRIAREACRQSGGYHVTALVWCDDLAQALQGFTQIVFAQAGAREPMISVVDGSALVIGPEGGLTDEECAQLARLGARAVGIGKRTLRARSAAVVLPAACLAGRQ